MTRWTVALYMALVFACGGVVGAFAHRLYTVSGVSANVGQRNPEEFRKRFMADMKARLQLNDDQAAKLGTIMDETRARFRDVRGEIRAGDAEDPRGSAAEDQRIAIARPAGRVAKNHGRTATAARAQEGQRRIASSASA